MRTETIHFTCCVLHPRLLREKKERRLFFPPHIASFRVLCVWCFSKEDVEFFILKGCVYFKEGNVTKCIWIMGLCNSMLSVACRAHWELINMLWLQSQAKTVAKLWLEILYKFAVFTLGSQKFFFCLSCAFSDLIYCRLLCMTQRISASSHQCIKVTFKVSRRIFCHFLWINT